VAERRVAALLKELGRGSGTVVAGPWPDGPVTELLVWIPFLREAVARGAIATQNLVAVVRTEAEPWYSGVAAATVSRAPAEPNLPAEPVLTLLHEIREDRAPIRSLAGRLCYAKEPATARYSGPWNEVAALAVSHGAPTIVTVTTDQAATVELDLAFRAARSLHAPFGLVAADAAREAAAFLEPGG
jgi:hypothetical protein